LPTALALAPYVALLKAIELALTTPVPSYARTLAMHQARMCVIGFILIGVAMWLRRGRLWVSILIELLAVAGLGFLLYDALSKIL